MHKLKTKLTTYESLKNDVNFSEISLYFLGKLNLEEKLK